LFHASLRDPGYTADAQTDTLPRNMRRAIQNALHVHHATKSGQKVDISMLID